MKSKKLKLSMILLIFLLSCKTMAIKLESPKDFTAEYEKCKTHNDIHQVNANRIIELQRIIKSLWIQILYADKRKIEVIDLRESNEMPEMP